MRRRFCTTCCLLGSILLLTGCGKVANITEAESDQIAEVIAASVLKYDANYGDVLEYDESVLEVTPTPMPTPEPVEEPEADSTPASNSQSGGDEQQTTGDAPSVALSADFSSVIGESGYQVIPAGCELVQEYQDAFSDLSAPKGKSILVVKFQVKNTQSKTVKANLLEKRISYKATIDGTDIRPLYTIASNDLQYYNEKIGAGKKKTAVLLFEVDKGQSSWEKLTIMAKSQDAEATVAIPQ